MKSRRLAVTPQARRDLLTIIAWYRRELGASAAAKAARSIQAGIRACSTIEVFARVALIFLKDIFAWSPKLTW